MTAERYVLGVAGHPDTFTEVSRDEFIRAESAAGFWPKGGGSGPATGGFSSGGVRGSVVGPGHDFDEYLAWLKNDMNGPAPRFDQEKWRIAHEDKVKGSKN